ncbi:Oidioi.mRNA.OKI2018_I69.PAR.g12056.t1.cds [Oikopleura dioica]|uniref:Oidioi.mRNA.OKI2018_I69.PAR.g12056.t1.cds n=1 Tax=Oikopleura dioica TaxID=34765 RepID=A0ABN7S422_OIKDI|nr:Oidioi.mRNA.OKI2018_I69.PAR.g12056.t1.cds [Oikopleura dioica]
MVNRCNIEAHERHRCNKRPSKCRYNFAGCDWKGPLDKLDTHTKACKYKFATCESAKEEIEKSIDVQGHQARVKDNILSLFAFDSVIYTGDSQSCTRQISFSLSLRVKPQYPRDIQLFVTRAPGSDFQLDHVTYLHRFTKDISSTPLFTLPLKSAAEVNRFISSKSVNLRVYMFEMNELNDTRRNNGQVNRDPRGSW